MTKPPRPITPVNIITMSQAMRAVRRSRPKLVKLKPPVGDAQMAKTLLFLLETARQGKVKALSICLIVQRPDGTERSVESASANGDDDYELKLLGVMRGAENGLFKRRDERRDE